MEDISGGFTNVIMSLLIATPRIFACFVVFPVLGFRSLQGLLRTGVVFSLSLIIAVGVFHEGPVVTLMSIEMLFLLSKEAIIGMLIGFFLSLPFWAFETIGGIFDMQRGAMMGEYLNPETGSMSSMFGPLLQKTLIVVMIEIGAFAWIFGLIIESYTVWPATQSFPIISMDAYLILIDAFNEMFMKTVVYALPLIFTLICIDLLFGVLGVYSPHLQTYFISMPAKSLLGMAVLAVYGSLLWEYGQNELFAIRELFSRIRLIFL